jgi:hypothetical protein
MDVWRVALLALTIIMEARSQPELGKLMVAQVAVNRAGAGAVESTLFQPAQFASWSPGVFAEGHLLRLAVLECWAVGAFPDDPWCVERYLDSRGAGRRLWIGSAEGWAEAWRLAASVYYGEWEAPAELAGKTHFDNPGYWPSGLPAWLCGCVEVGDHVFCE